MQFTPLCEKVREAKIQKGYARPTARLWDALPILGLVGTAYLSVAPVSQHPVSRPHLQSSEALLDGAPAVLQASTSGADSKGTQNHPVQST